MADFESYMKAWSELAENVKKQLGPFNEELTQSLLRARKQWEELLEPQLVAQEQLAELVRSFAIPKIDLSYTFPKFDPPDLSQLKLVIEATKSLHAAIEPSFAEIRESLKALPSRMREALLVLGKHGWYLDFELSLPDLWALKKALSEGDLARAEKELIDHFEGRLGEIEKTLANKFPHRAHVIHAAFRAHRRQEYVLSIPALLAQTDGVCKELTNKYLFIRENKRPEVAAYVQQFLANAFQASLLSPLTEVLPIGTPQRERAPDSEQLNRHAVLHGESVKYGTQTNSLKTISLLNYVVHVL